MTDTAPASTKELDFAIGFTHGVNTTLQILVETLWENDRTRFETFVTRLHDAADALTPDQHAYARVMAEHLRLFAGNLVRSPEERAKLSAEAAAIRLSK